MTAKEYLSQARYLDNRIKSKLLQIDSLNELATRCTPSYSDMPKSPNREGSRMESAILDIIELEDEISKDVVELVALKKEIVEVIKQVGNTEYQTLLEERYSSCVTQKCILMSLVSAMIRAPALSLCRVSARCPAGDSGAFSEQTAFSLWALSPVPFGNG